MKLLDEDQNLILGIIGESNVDCIKVFKYIISSANSTPNNANQSNSKQHYNFTPST
jgi:hypothetical protein